MSRHPLYPLGSVHGRFQGLHRGHAEYILSAMERCHHLLVGIAMPDPGNLSGHEVDRHRHDALHNPFSFYERAQMIRACLFEAGYSTSDFEVYPFPIDDLASVSNYLPSRTDVTLFTTIYDRWGEHKTRALRELGFAVEVMWRRDPSSKVASGAELRRRMRAGENWAALVTPAVESTILELGLAARLRVVPREQERRRALTCHPRQRLAR